MKYLQALVGSKRRLCFSDFFCQTAMKLICRSTAMHVIMYCCGGETCWDNTDVPAPFLPINALLMFNSEQSWGNTWAEFHKHENLLLICLFYTGSKEKHRTRRTESAQVWHAENSPPLGFLAMNPRLRGRALSWDVPWALGYWITPINYFFTVIYAIFFSNARVLPRWEWAFGNDRASLCMESRRWIDATLFWQKRL